MIVSDSDYLHIAQASDLKTAVGLARSKNGKMNLFLKPPQLPESKEPELERKFRNIIATLPKQGVAHCVAYLTKHVMDRGHFYHTTESGDWYFGSEAEIRDRRFKRVAADTMRMFYLDALLSHSTVASHRRLIVEKGGLQLLMDVVKISPQVQVCSLVAQIIGNLALDDSLHSLIYEAGWVRLLAQWLKNENIEISVPAARALANLDRDALKDFFDDGVYVLHPLYRLSANENITADVVFVHGLTGGAFKTWRQRDESALPDPVDEDKNTQGSIDAIPVLEKRRDMQLVMEDMTMISKKHLFPGEEGGVEKKAGNWFKNLRATSFVPSHTACWPKDWLPVDCPHVRIISVDFDAEVSEWFRKCPGEAEKSTIAMRSYDLLQRLLKAGIGQRPIIWVSHSLGGLLVKKLLVTCNQSSDTHMSRIWRRTKGVVFFSVPHRGSEWANWGSTERLIMLTQEVQELKYNSTQLIDLHRQFQDIVEAVHLPCLSFGETLKTKLGLKVEAMFVSPYSADPGFGEFITVATDHVNVCKPVNRRSKLYLLVLEFIYENIPHSIIESIMAPAVGKFDEDAILEQYMW
uniref:Protein SERAC1 n=1 Tax=Strigamia maritima TaxID=126957 RepID=T1JG54_STRMM